MRLFFSQERVDAWNADGQATLDGATLALADGRRFRLTEAVHVARLAGGDDRAGLVGKVKSHAAIAQIGGELMETALIVGETAYDVRPGFLAEPL